MVSVTVIDHGAGNLRSVARALEAVGATVQVTGDVNALRDAGWVVFPGQGAFGDCMTRLRATGLQAVIERHIRQGKPYLGICLGLQVLFQTGHERGEWAGLGVLAGSCERLPTLPGVKVPHMGWNQVDSEDCDALQHTWLRSLPREWYYFVHSYRVLPAPNQMLERVTVHHDGIPIVAAVARENVMACQFHPEKSHRGGLELLRSFLEFP